MPVGEQGIVDTILSFAANEAVEAGYSEISRAHLLIALSRISEAQDSPDSAAIGDLKREFDQLGVDPRSFRRRLRAILGRRDRKPSSNTIHRSVACKAVFAVAQRDAAEAREPLTPVWLLRSVFACLADEVPRVAAKNGSADDIPFEL